MLERWVGDLLIPLALQRSYNSPSTSLDTALVPSSMKAYLGSWYSSLAMPTRCFSPPLNTSFHTFLVSHPPSRSGM
jgi:hypothetical protein